MNPIRKFCNWYFSRGTLPYWCILALDCVAVFMSGLSVYYIKYGGLSLAQHFWQLCSGLGICLLAYVVAFFAFHTFRGVMRYSSFVDLSRIAYSNIAAGVFVCLVHQVEAKFGHSYIYMTPRFESAILIYIIATSIMWGLRVIVKTLHNTYRGDDSVQKVFIYGCMQGGIALAKSIRNQTPLRFRLRGFISGDKTLDGSWLLGEQVHYDEDSVVELMKKQKVTTLLVSPLQTENFTHRTTLIESLIAANIKIMMMPQSEEWDGHSDLSHQQLREVEIEDLLPREKIQVDLVAIGQMLRGKRILITGAAGSIGSEMARQVAKFQPAELVLVDQAETPMHDVRLYMANNHKDLSVQTIVTSICKEARMEKIFAKYKPEYVFHAAAYKHVPMMEDNPAEAVQNNIYGTRVIADLAVKYGTKKFVMISTDKAVNPTNVMGCSKRICEIYCQALNKAIVDGEVKGETQFVTTRFGNVLGSNGSVIPIFREQIKKGGPVKVTHPEIIRFFMLIPEACRLVLEAGTMGKGGEIFVFDMGEPVKIVDLAQRMINLSGAKNVKIEFSGLRDGEKLFEEVLNDAEQTKPTHHPKIKVAAVREYPYELACQNEIELHEISFTADDMDIVRKMKEIVPEYKSQNSKYQELDI
ncbi:MAG: polysaccharide biosynthesis protein [Prevotella sp.]|nr:polysaccharide biosynthesis protein [Candidatus Prevotella equi]